MLHNITSVQIWFDGFYITPTWYRPYSSNNIHFYGSKSMSISTSLNGFEDIDGFQRLYNNITSYELSKSAMVGTLKYSTRTLSNSGQCRRMCFHSLCIFYHINPITDQHNSSLTSQHKNKLLTYVRIVPTS